ncbi:hypothetical protein N6P31_20700 [Pectobacterium betavasculorum]|uniref:hypothetical protein n=1 Tax=Pectobacterium betavasculorum TaxID=55207 RepID=UPI00313C8146
MELFLLRHGKPNIRSSTAIRSVDMHSWIGGYDAAGILDSPNASTVAACKERFVVSSPMPRALESVDALGLEPDIIIDELHEAPLPVFNIPLLKLTPPVWAALFRIFWMAGGSGGVETFSSVKIRATLVSSELDRMAEAHGRVLSVGHGFMNVLVARELHRIGWKRQKVGPSGYWSGIKLVR